MTAPMKLVRSISGMASAGLFSVLALIVLLLHLYSVVSNPGDSGESGIMLIPFSLPWILLVPSQIREASFWVRGCYVFYFAVVVLNAAIIYAVVSAVSALVKKALKS